MPIRPATPGLIKWQLYYRDVQTGGEAGAVQTFWTYRDEDPIPDARFNAERDAILAWTHDNSVRQITSSNTWWSWIRGYDFGFRPTHRRMNHRIWPVAAGTNRYTTMPPQVSAVIALRSQPVGSAIKDRRNGHAHHPYASLPIDGNGNIQASERGFFENAYNVLLASLKTTANPDRGNWVVPLFFEDGVARPGGPDLVPVNHVICRAQPGVVRSRLAHPGPYARGA